MSKTAQNWATFSVGSNLEGFQFSWKTENPVNFCRPNIKFDETRKYFGPGSLTFREKIFVGSLGGLAVPKVHSIKKEVMQISLK